MTGADGGDSNGSRVTNALIGAKLDGLADSFNECRAEVKKWQGDHDVRVRDLERIAAVNQTKIAMIIGGSAGIGGVVGAVVSVLAKAGGVQ